MGYTFGAEESDSCLSQFHKSWCAPVSKPISFLAEKAAEVVVYLAEGKPVIVRSVVENRSKEVTSILVAASMVTKKNIRETVVKDDFHPEADIYRNAPVDAP